MRKEAVFNDSAGIENDAEGVDSLFVVVVVVIELEWRFFFSLVVE